MARRRTTAEPSGHTILVVDDQEETLVSNRLLLEREGHQVLTALSGEEALRLFRPEEVNLVIVDYFFLRRRISRYARAHPFDWRDPCRGLTAGRRSLYHRESAVALVRNSS